MSETTMLLKVGATDLVLRMVEAGVVMRDLTLENPIRAIRDVSHDMTGRRKVRLANGREASALDIQREYLAKAKDFTDRRGAVERACRDLDIFEAKSVPPQTTRARLRGEFIRRAQERRRDFTVDWVHLKLNDQAQRTVLCKDPFRAVDDRVEKLIATM